MMIFSMFRVVWVMLVWWYNSWLFAEGFKFWRGDPQSGIGFQISSGWYGGKGIVDIFRAGGGVVEIALVQINIWFWVLFFFQNELYLGSVITLVWFIQFLAAWRGVWVLKRSCSKWIWFHSLWWVIWQEKSFKYFVGGESCHLCW